MRRVHLSDINLAVRVLLAVRPDRRAAVMGAMVLQAHAADKFRKRHARLHPRWGGGRLADACLARPIAARPDGCDPTYLACLGVVAAVLSMKKRDC